jgi:hypothetical protein
VISGHGCIDLSIENEGRENEKRKKKLVKL